MNDDEPDSTRYYYDAGGLWRQSLGRACVCEDGDLLIGGARLPNLAPKRGKYIRKRHESVFRIFLTENHETGGEMGKLSGKPPKLLNLGLLARISAMKPPTETSKPIPASETTKDKFRVVTTQLSYEVFRFLISGNWKTDENHETFLPNCRGTENHNEVLLMYNTFYLLYSAAKSFIETIYVIDRETRVEREGVLEE